MFKLSTTTATTTKTVIRSTLFRFIIFLLSLYLVLQLFFSGSTLLTRYHAFLNQATAFNSHYSNLYWKLGLGVGSTHLYSNKRSFFTSSSTSSWSSTGGSGGSWGSGATTGPQVFNYKVAVAYQAKDRTDPIYSKWNLPPLPPTGEDNYFIALPNISELYCGVADGVGGWIDMGYDSSAISQQLMLTMKSISEQSQKQITPKQLLSLAYDQIQKDGIVQAGSTTAVVAHLSESGKLSVSNLGDSWCGVFRENKLVFQTKFQTLGFNTPYQLSVIPPKILEDAKRRGSSYITNTPQEADDYSFQLQTQDVVVLATDGVTDNIDTADIELFLKNNQDSDKDLTTLTQEFVSQVVKLSKDPYFPSVFSQELSKASGKNYVGGKEDDITCVVVKVE